MAIDKPLSAGDLPVLRDVVGHHSPVPFMLTREMFGGIPVEMGGAEISELVGRPVADPHVHETPEIYLLFSRRPGEAVITIEVEGESFELTSFGAFYVPAGMRHRFITREAAPGSFCMGLFINVR